MSDDPLAAPADTAEGELGQTRMSCLGGVTWNLRSLTAQLAETSMGSLSRSAVNWLLNVVEGLAVPDEMRQQQLQRLIDDLWDIFRKTPKEIAQQFGESRCVDDHARINYAQELMADFVSGSVPAATPAQEVNMIQVIEGSERWYCRVIDCDEFTEKNIPFGYCDVHAEDIQRGETLQDKCGFPPIGSLTGQRAVFDVGAVHAPAESRRQCDASVLMDLLRGEYAPCVLRKGHEGHHQLAATAETRRQAIELGNRMALEDELMEVAEMRQPPAGEIK